MIEANRLRLRPHRVEDFNRYLPLWLMPEPAGSKACAQRGRNLGATAAVDRALAGISLWIVYRRRRSSPRQGLHIRSAELAITSTAHGSWVARLGDTSRAGIAVEVMSAVMPWFDAQSINTRTVCLIHEGNVASVRVASRVGFKTVGTCEFQGHPATLFERTTA